jgi:hypothetical protein
VVARVYRLPPFAIRLFDQGGRTEG